MSSNNFRKSVILFLSNTAFVASSVGFTSVYSSKAFVVASAAAVASFRLSIYIRASAELSPKKAFILVELSSNNSSEKILTKGTVDNVLFIKSTCVFTTALALAAALAISSTLLNPNSLAFVSA